MKMNIKEGVVSLETLDELSDLLLNHTTDGIVLLEGELGAGKTTFIKHLLQKIGVVESITSPTFSLVNHYHSPLRDIIHADLYRVKKSQEIEGLGLDYTGKNLLLIEWGEQFESLLTPIKAKISLSYLASDTINQRSYRIELL
ncbi:tRNA (adenosine(37)-N6)-threonylcarbamoyltransferase complex ATPase subunit type 1 TsaE [bacterium]|jgi:tRNA threonylcarbamoyladenosine biosynthesis protein TsaE|nr:tRNA (adenosine(37)-N6)-threonylcarbamoyltransferase complex ATPase subunit type 1 TsaE [bacterium]NBX72189.1 tRNA (adenosine(37)-N6)-threonylcarbamoyltransferase complex ATPase subunit type 1 TsaE [bacterium]